MRPRQPFGRELQFAPLLTKDLVSAYEAAGKKEEWEAACSERDTFLARDAAYRKAQFTSGHAIGSTGEDLDDY